MWTDVSLDEYNELLDARRLLNCLRACGVDERDGWSDAYDMFIEGYGDED